MSWQLSAAKDGSVVIASVGFLTNLLDLLRSSSADGGLALSGVELVAKKVAQLVMMGGSLGNRIEWNLGGCGGTDGGRCGSYDALGAISREVLLLWPTTVPVTFVAFEPGADVHTGGRLGSWEAPDDHPGHVAYQRFCSDREYVPWWCSPRGRASWDPMAVLYAVRGPEVRPPLRPSALGPSLGCDHRVTFGCPQRGRGSTSWLRASRPSCRTVEPTVGRRPSIWAVIVSR